MNKVYEGKMYNEEIKNDFLDGYIEETKSVYRRIFYETSKVEELLGRDLFNFTKDEIEDVLYSLSPLTVFASRTNVSIISSYIDWAIKNGYKKTNINYFRVLPVEYYQKFVRKEKLYVSERQLINIEEFCANAQDAVLFRLLFEIGGGKGCIEIRNLTKDDVDFRRNRLRLINEKNIEREVDVSSRCIALIGNAIDETTYLKRNGYISENTGSRGAIRPFTDLVRSNYVIRNSITRTNDENIPVDKHTVYRRISMINNLFGLYPYLSTKNIITSGMIKMVKDMLEEDGRNSDELNRYDFKRIAKKFNKTESTIYSLKKIIKDQVKELYNI